MNKINLIVAIIGLIGQILGFVGIFISETNDQLIFSYFTFMGFSILGAIALLMDKKEIF